MDEAIRFDPDFAKAYDRRGVVYENLEQYDRAIEDYDRAIDLETLDGTFWVAAAATMP